MPDQPRALRQRRCCFSACLRVFHICRSCDRGQRYCCEPCRLQARRQQCREANRRHQQSVEGRADHRDRQRAYRARLRLGLEQPQARVTDQGRQTGPSQATIGVPLPAALLMPGPVSGKLLEQRHERFFLRLRPAGQVFCIRCGRAGRFIELFRGG